MNAIASNAVGILLGVLTGAFVTLGLFPFLFIVTLLSGKDAEALYVSLLFPALIAGVYAGWCVARRRIKSRGEWPPPVLIRAYTGYTAMVIVLGCVLELLDRSGKGMGFLAALVLTYLPFRYLLPKYTEPAGSRRTTTP